MGVTRVDALSSLGDEPPEPAFDEQRDAWNSLRQAAIEEEEDRLSRLFCGCQQAYPDNPNFVLGHDYGACDCQCSLCWRARSAYELAVRQTEQDGSCFCRKFWSETACAVGACHCTCETCRASQADFRYHEEKILVETRLAYWSEEAAKAPMEYPYGHDQWCECDSCDPINKHNAAITAAEAEVYRAQSWLSKREKEEHEAWLKSPAGIAETARLAEIEIAEQRELAEKTQQKMLEISMERERLAIEGPPARSRSRSRATSARPTCRCSAMPAAATLTTRRRSAGCSWRTPAITARSAWSGWCPTRTARSRCTCSSGLSTPA